MTTILPEKNRKELRSEYVSMFIAKVAWVAVLILTVGIVLESAVFVSMKMEQTSLKDQSEEEKKEEREKMLEKYKLSLTEVKDITNKFDLENSSKLKIVNYLFSIKPEKLSLLSIQVVKDNEKNKVSLSGFSSDRDSLLKYTKTLEENPLVEEFDFPVSNLTKNVDIPFTLNFVYKKNE